MTTTPLTPSPAKVLALLLIACSWLGSPAATLAEAEAEQALCPVCRVHDGETEQEDVVATFDFDGQSFGFCSEGCRDKFAETPEPYLPPVLPRTAPPFQAQDLEGNLFSSDTLKGRVILLDFWATWCQPCVDDLPRLSKLHERYAERGLSVVGLATDEGDDASRKVARMIKRRKATHPVFLDATDTPAWSAYKVRVVPSQFLIDSDGNIVAQWSGKIDLGIVEAAITEILPDTEAAGP